MITLDTSVLVLVIVAAALGGALVAVLPPWRHMRHAGSHLPVWAFLARRDTTLERITALQAELRCETCDAKEPCRRHLAAGATAPIAGCPNQGLFAAASAKAPAQPAGA